MRWLNKNGKLVWKNDSKYRIKWDQSSRSKEQTKLKQFLYQYWKNDIVFEEYLLPFCLLRADFLNASKKIAIEHMGTGCHNEYNPFFHNQNRMNYLSSIKRDIKKVEILQKNGFTVLETFTSDLNKLSYQFFIETYGVYL